LAVSEKIRTFAKSKLNLTYNGMNNIESQKGEIVMYQPDETIRLEVRMGEETVWLTQQQMAELFDTDRSSITKHINNIYETEELTEKPTCAKIAQVRKEGKRMVKRHLVYYNLDMIISVGYRVNSKRGTKFRQWAIPKVIENTPSVISITPKENKNTPREKHLDPYVTG
jgi:hypothetical protein